MKGIDVSHWQGNITNWSAIKKSGIDFVIIRAGYGSFAKQKDEKFEQNYANAKAAGLKVGAYWYSYATNTTQAIIEAKTFLSVIRGKQFEMPVWFDQEYEACILALSKSTRTAIVKEFCKTVEDAGYYTGLYCSRDWLSTKVDASKLSNLDIWVAAYGDSAGNVPLPYGIWQCSSTNYFKVPGNFYTTVNGKKTPSLDCDYAYKDYEGIMKSNGLNGFVKEPVSDSLPVVNIYGLTNVEAYLIWSLSKYLSVGYVSEWADDSENSQNVTVGPVSDGDIDRFVKVANGFGKKVEVCDG